MTWIAQRKDAEVMAAIREGVAGFPPEYGPERRQQSRVPESVKRDSIVTTHSLAPNVLRLLFQALRAMYDPELPLDRRQHETIATVVSVINECFH